MMTPKFEKMRNPSQVPELVAIAASYGDPALDLKKLEMRYAKEYAQTENRMIFLARDEGGDAIGCAQLILEEADNDPELANGFELAHVHDLRIKAKLQGRGFGRQFMEFLERYSRTIGIEFLTLGVDSWNDRAIRLYLSLGYSSFKDIEGRTPQERCLYMKRRIAQEATNLKFRKDED